MTISSPNLYFTSHPPTPLLLLSSLITAIPQRALPPSTKVFLRSTTVNMVVIKVIVLATAIGSALALPPAPVYSSVSSGTPPSSEAHRVNGTHEGSSHHGHGTSTASIFPSVTSGSAPFEPHRFNGTHGASSHHGGRTSTTSIFPPVSSKGPTPLEPYQVNGTHEDPPLHGNGTSFNPTAVLKEVACCGDPNPPPNPTNNMKPAGCIRHGDPCKTPCPSIENLH